MALTKLRNYNPGTDGAFVTLVDAFEAGIVATPATHRRVLITSDDGTCQGYERIADGALFCGALVTPNGAKIAADAAAASAAATTSAKDTAALNAIQAGVDQFRTGGAGTLTNVQRDRWLAGLTWILFRRE